MKGLALLVAVLASAHLASALYTKGGPVSLLSPASFDKVLNSKLPVFVEFFAPWCGHCKSLAPAYAKAAEKMAGIVPFVAVDCDAEKNKQLCGQYGIQGFPTLKTFVNGKPTDYQGERSAKAMVTAVTALLSSKGVKELKSAADAEAFTKPSAATKVLLLTDKGTISPLYKSLSARYAGKLTFGQAHKSVGDLAATHATSFPTLLVFAPEGEAIKYEGELKPQKLIDFLKDFAGAGKKADAKQEEKKDKPKKEEEKKDKPKKEEEKKDKPKKQAEDKPKKKAEESEKEPEKPPAMAVVRNLTLAGVKAQLKEEGGIHLLAFYNSADACAERLAKLNAAVLGTTGLVRAGQVPVAAGQASVLGDIYPVDAAALGGDACSVQAFMLPFEDRDDTDEWKLYTGELESKDLAKWAMKFFPDKHVTAVDEETHQQWAMTDVSRPKVLLFTDKAEPPALYRALSTNLQKLNMDFGMASGASEEFKKRFNAVRTPYIVATVGQPSPDEKGPNGEPRMLLSMQPYSGRMNYKDISQFLMMVSMRMGTGSMGQFEDLLGTAKPPPAVTELADAAVLEAACTSKGGICVIAALDPTAPKHADHLEALQAVAALRDGQPLAFSWVSAKAHAAFVRSLGATPANTPAVVALSPKKLRYAVMTSAFSKASVGEFLDGVLTGKVSTAPMAAMPELGAPGAEPEAAEEEAPVEEEFDLSDIMSEELEDGALGKRKDEL